MVWRMIGSSPDVIMTSAEWLVGVFGSRKTLRKGLPLAFRSLGIRSFEPLRRYALRKTLEMQRPNDVTTKPDAQNLVVKLMDHALKTGCPLIVDLPYWFECRVTDTVKRGDHTVFVGETVSAGVRDDSAVPLLLRDTGMNYGG